jgi:hypothetical protein
MLIAPHAAKDIRRHDCIRPRFPKALQANLVKAEDHDSIAGKQQLSSLLRIGKEFLEMH